MSRKEVYNEILLDHNLYPRNCGKIEENDFERVLVNASCGDKICVQFKIQDNKIIDGKFQGVGCAISLASADLMIEEIRGKTIEKAKELNEDFRKMILGCDVDLVKMGKVAVLHEVSRMPARIKCANLAWQAIDFIETDKK